MMSDKVKVAPNYNTPIPNNITTPDRVETRIGTLEFFDGLPSPETSKIVFDNLDLLRGVEVFLNCIPMTSLDALRKGHEYMGAKKSNQMLLANQLMDSNPLFLTGNTDTVYCSGFLDLERDGPTVVEIPPGCGPGTVNDAFFRFVVDMGAPGPDRGQGGAYLILPPNYKSVAPDGYFVARSPSFVNGVVLRGFLVDGKPDVANTMFKTGVKIYPLKDKNNPPQMEFINSSKIHFNTIHANNFDFYEELNQVIQREPIEMLDPEIRGLIASIGIVKGKLFAPDERMKIILTEAVAVGNATARSIAFNSRLQESYYYEGSSWATGFVGGSHEWLVEGGKGGRYLDARTLFFYAATVNTPAMALKMVGVGSQYAYTAKDKKGNYLDGSKNYKLNLPPNPPAKDFWSVVIYDPQTRSELQTNQPYPSKNNKRDDLIYNDDGSVDLYFGPNPPGGLEKNCTQTVPGKGWFTILRLYGPLESWFDKTWRPGEIELVE
jgi:hypothetical protein